MTSAEKEILPPNASDGEHRWRGVTLTGKIIEIGRSDIYDSIFDCHLVDCVIRTFRGARGVDIFRCTLISSFQLWLAQTPCGRMQDGAKSCQHRWRLPKE